MMNLLKRKSNQETSRNQLVRHSEANRTGNQHDLAGWMPWGTGDPFFRGQDIGLGSSLVPGLRQELNRMFEQLFDDRGEWWPRWASRASDELWSGADALVPSIDVKDRKKEFCITAEIPGIDEKDLHVEVQGNSLVISGEKREESDEETKDGWHRVERRFGSFHRAIPLPDNVDVDAVKADYKKGVLKVKFPKTAARKEEPRRIEVHGSSRG